MKNNYISAKYILYIIFCTLLFGNTGSAQEIEMDIPNLKKIESSIRDFNSEMYYPRLMRRYINNDTTLTLNEFRTSIFRGIASKKAIIPTESPLT